MAHKVTRTRLKPAFPPPKPSPTKLLELIDDTGFFSGVFTCMEIAEEWIERAKKTAPPGRQAAVHAMFKHLCPPHDMAKLHVGIYRMHVCELVKRAIQGDNISLGTDAEVILALHTASLKSPLAHYVVCAYERLMARGVEAGFFGDTEIVNEPTPMSPNLSIEVEEFINETKMKMARHTGRPPRPEMPA